MKPNNLAMFSDPVSNLEYADRTKKIVPGLMDMYKMAGILLSENAPANAKVLVLGAGGGLELEAFTNMYPNWTFDGVDTSLDMISQASRRLGEKINRVKFYQCEIEATPLGLYDSATCILTLHFMKPLIRLKTLQALHKRLKPGSPLVVAHHSFPNDELNGMTWLKRLQAFAKNSGIPSQTANNLAAIRDQLPILDPAEDIALLKQAGFKNIQLFYAGFTVKGWVGFRGVHPPFS